MDCLCCLAWFGAVEVAGHERLGIPRMMKIQTRSLPYRLSFAVAPLVLFTTMPLCAQTSSARPAAASPAAANPQAASPQQTPAEKLQPTEIKIVPVTPTAEATTPAPDRGQAYFHAALATIYVEQAEAQGRPEFATKAIEEYKLALNSDPNSPQLNNGLAELYFRIGRAHDAENTARELLKSSPDNLEAHKLLGKIYLRQLSEGTNAEATTSALNAAIVEFEKIIALQPKSVEDRMVLGQLYTVKHDAKKAEEEFKKAQAVEPDSEDVVLNLARLYAESGDLTHAAKVIEDVPEADRSPKMELALGAAFEQLKQPKEAIAAYRRAVDQDNDDAHARGTLAQALFNDNQLDEALKEFQELAKADPEDAGALIHIAEVQQRQEKYAEALKTIRQARKKDPESLEAGYHEGLLLDVLGRFDEAVEVYEKMVDLTSHANGAYKADEKNNRGIFLERLGAVYQEQNKVDQAVATYQKLIDMGGETAVNGYKAQVGAYTDAKQFDKAVEVARKAVAANPTDNEMKLILAGELADQGKTDEGLALTKSLLTNSKDDRAVWIGLGQIYVRARRWKEAEEAFNKAEPLTTRKEDRSYLLFLRGEMAERQKHYEPAEQFFRQVLDLDPTSTMTLNYLGYMLADKNMRLPEALKMIRKAVEIEPMNGAYLDSLGWVYFKMGEYELAEENLRQAVQRDSTDPTVHDHLAELYEKTGRIRLAAQQWELSIVAFAKSSPADVEPGDVAKVQKKLDSARAKLARQESAVGKPE